MVERFEHLGFLKGDAKGDVFSEARTKLRWEKQASP
jgi:hypothetical protein